MYRCYSNCKNTRQQDIQTSTPDFDDPGYGDRDARIRYVRQIWFALYHSDLWKYYQIPWLVYYITIYLGRYIILTDTLTGISYQHIPVQLYFITIYLGRYNILPYTLAGISYYQIPWLVYCIRSSGRPSQTELWNNSKGAWVAQDQTNVPGTDEHPY